MLKRRKRFWAVTIPLMLIAALVVWKMSRVTSVETAGPPPVELDREPNADVAQLSMSELLTLAREAREHIVEHVDDYTARFVKQERNADGVLMPKSVYLMKVQTRHRGGKEGSPMRVYLDFIEPESVKGREVIWAKDLYDGKLVVHEAGLLGLVTVYLDPNGLLALQGERYPISEIGLTRLVEKLIERGEENRNDPDISVTMTDGHMVGDTPTKLIQIKRSKPQPGENDFSLAEIAYDEERQLILQYRSFGWPEAETPVSVANPVADDPAPLLESYTYYDVKLNVGLTAKDFDPANPEYRYP